MSNRIAIPSAHDVARLAGVSQAAVSRAFTPGACISDATRDKVLFAAKQLGYRPNLIARSLIKGRSDIIGVVVGNARNPFFTLALDLLSTRLRRARRHLLVFTGQSNEYADVQVEDLLKYRVDGLILMWTSLSPALAEQCRKEGIPVVFLDSRASTTEGFVTVSGANSRGPALIADHLLQRGYRRIAFMAGYQDSATNREREAAFTTRLISHGQAIPMRVVGNFRREPAREATRALLSLNSRPDAIFCANDEMALGALEVARYEFGIDVGRELGIAGFDDIGESSWPTFLLTTYSHPLEEMMDKLADVILDPVQYEPRPQFVMEGELKIRASTDRGRPT